MMLLDIGRGLAPTTAPAIIAPAGPYLATEAGNAIATESEDRLIPE
jgi:hypothetical protein